MMHFSLPITKYFFDFTLECLWNVQIEKNENLKKNIFADREDRTRLAEFGVQCFTIIPGRLA